MWDVLAKPGSTKQSAKHSTGPMRIRPVQKKKYTNKQTKRKKEKEKQNKAKNNKQKLKNLLKAEIFDHNGLSGKLAKSGNLQVMLQKKKKKKKMTHI